MIFRMGQQINKVEKLNDGARPSMRDYERLRTRSASFLADKMDVNPIDWSNEVIKLTYALLLLSPIKFCGPVVTKLSQVVQICAVVPPPSSGISCHGNEATRLLIASIVSSEMLTLNGSKAVMWLREPV